MRILIGSPGDRRCEKRHASILPHHACVRAASVLMAAVVFVVAACSAAELSTHTTARFSGAGNCAFCHDQLGQALTDAAGNSLSITEDWRGTMMAHSFRDPFWRATMEAEVAEHPKMKELIETKCLTCHASMARVDAKERGSESLAASRAQKNPLSGEGVGCTLCHQILPDNLGQAESFTGGFRLGQDRTIFGPYDEVVTMPMQRHVDYTPSFGRHVQNSALCGTCHTLFTPVFAKDGRVAGRFAEQTPFLEWRHSDYPRQGRHCQDCHLPLVKEPVKISARPPWLDTREPFWRHQFVGGNAFILQMLADNSTSLKANADQAQFGPLIEETRKQLGRAVKISARASREGGTGVLLVELENLTGHKFPSAHPYRRAWLHVRITDSNGTTLFESGAVDGDGRIRGMDTAYEEHYETISEAKQVQVYQAVMGDADGEPTWSLLKAASRLKDNRLLPKGFRAEGEDQPHIKVCGKAEMDPDYQAGSGMDRLAYRFPLGTSAGKCKAEVELLYQTAPPESVARLLTSKLPEAKRFTALYRQAAKAPELVSRWDGTL